MRLRKMLLLLVVLLVFSETVLGQKYFSDTCICYTDNMDKKCIECMVNSLKRQELIDVYALEVERLGNVNRSNVVLLDKCNVSLVDSHVKLMVFKKLIFVSSIASFFLGALFF